LNPIRTERKRHPGFCCARRFPSYVSVAIQNYQVDDMTTRITSNPAIKWGADALIRQRRLAEADQNPVTNKRTLEQVRILRDVIDPRVLLNEPELAESRWPQYGYVSATDATQDFAKIYVTAYDYWHKKYIDSYPHPCPVDSDFFNNEPGIMNALYSARQFADSLGIPYVSFIFGMFGRLTDVGRYKRIPTPNHLFPPLAPRKRKGRKQYKTKAGNLVEHKAIRHACKVKESLRERHPILGHDWDQRFMARNYVGDPAQERALQALVTHPDISTPRSRLRDRLEKGRISPENAFRVFPGLVAQGAIDDASAMPDISVPDAGLSPFRPHCLGLIQMQAPAPQCMQCPWIDKCAQLAQWAEREQMAMTGYKNRADRERQEARIRQRVSRASKKAEKACSDAGIAGLPSCVTSPNMS
jgi:hypothetical protein